MKIGNEERSLRVIERAMSMYGRGWAYCVGEALGVMLKSFRSGKVEKFTGASNDVGLGEAPILKFRADLLQIFNQHSNHQYHALTCTVISGKRFNDIKYSPVCN